MAVAIKGGAEWGGTIPLTSGLSRVVGGRCSRDRIRYLPVLAETGSSQIQFRPRFGRTIMLTDEQLAILKQINSSIAFDGDVASPRIQPPHVTEHAATNSVFCVGLIWRRQ